MNIEFTHVSGTRRGDVQSFDDIRIIRFGRQPRCEVVFDSNLDKRASGEHAEIQVENRQFVLYDLQSTNGTFVNGERIERRVLRDGDLIEFGRGGPQVSCAIPTALRQPLPSTAPAAGTRPAPAPPPAAAGPPPPPSPEPPAEPASASGNRAKKYGARTLAMIVDDALLKARKKGGGRFGSTTVFMQEVVKQAVQAGSARLKIAVAFLVILLLAVSGGLMYRIYQQDQLLAETRTEYERELTTFQKRFSVEKLHAQQRVDSLQAVLTQARRDVTVGRAQMQALQDILEGEKQHVMALNDRLNTINGQIVSLDKLTRDNLMSRRSFQTVARENEQSVFLICIHIPAKNNYKNGIGSGFAVSRNGLLLTNAHVAAVLLDLQRKLGANFRGYALKNGNPQKEYPIRRIIMHPQYKADAPNFTPDMAALWVDTGGEALRAVKLSPAAEVARVAPGYPLAVYGFPGATISVSNPVATLASGEIGRINDQYFLQHNCFTMGGNSGSAIFNLKGEVIGIHFAGYTKKIMVPVPVTDSRGKAVLNADGTPKIKLAEQSIKESVGLNHGVRVDLIHDFLRSL